MIKIEWGCTSGKDDPLWRVKRGLYSYLHPNTREILYIGKVDGTSVRQRWNYSAKSKFWDDLCSQLEIRQHAIIVGQLKLKFPQRHSIELLADVESLLIMKLQPRGNIQSKKKRVLRPGMAVACHGDWPVDRKVFIETA